MSKILPLEADCRTRPIGSLTFSLQNPEQYALQIRDMHKYAKRMGLIPADAKEAEFIPSAGTQQQRESLWELWGCSLLTYAHLEPSPEREILERFFPQKNISEHLQKMPSIAITPAYLWWIRELAGIDDTGRRYKHYRTLPEELELISGFELAPLNGGSSDGHFDKLLRLVRPSITHPDDPELFEVLRLNMAVILNSRIFLSGISSIPGGYKNLSLKDRIIKIQDKLLEGVDYPRKGIRTGQIGFGNRIYLGDQDNIETSLIQLGERIRAITLQKHLSPNRLLAEIWANLIKIQPLAYGNKRVSFLTALSYCAEKISKLPTQWIPGAFVGHRQLDPAIKSLTMLDKQTFATDSQVNLMEQCIGLLPHHTLEEYTKIVIDSAFTSRHLE